MYSPSVPPPWVYAGPPPTSPLIPGQVGMTLFNCPVPASALTYHGWPPGVATSGVTKNSFGVWEQNFNSHPVTSSSGSRQRSPSPNQMLAMEFIASCKKKGNHSKETESSFSTCSFCPQVCSSKTINEHFRVYHKEEVFQCKLESERFSDDNCDDCFLYLHELKNHLVERHQLRNFFLEDLVESHQITMPCTLAMYRCTECSSGSTTFFSNEGANGIQRHNHLYHQGQSRTVRYECRICYNVDLPNMAELTRHIAKKHSPFADRKRKRDRSTSNENSSYNVSSDSDDVKIVNVAPSGSRHPRRRSPIATPVIEVSDSESEDESRKNDYISSSSTDSDSSYSRDHHHRSPRIIKKGNWKKKETLAKSEQHSLRYPKPGQSDWKYKSPHYLSDDSDRSPQCDRQQQDQPDSGLMRAEREGRNSFHNHEDTLRSESVLGTNRQGFDFRFEMEEISDETDADFDDPARSASLEDYGVFVKFSEVISPSKRAVEDKKLENSPPSQQGDRNATTWSECTSSGRDPSTSLSLHVQIGKTTSSQDFKSRGKRDLNLKTSFSENMSPRKDHSIDTPPVQIEQSIALSSSSPSTSFGLGGNNASSSSSENIVTLIQEPKADPEADPITMRHPKGRERCTLFQCAACNTMLEAYEDMILHMEDSHNVHDISIINESIILPERDKDLIKYSCGFPECNTSFIGMSDEPLIWHLFSQHRDRGVQNLLRVCRICDSVFQKYRAIIDHIRTCHPRSQFAAPEAHHNPKIIF